MSFLNLNFSFDAICRICTFFLYTHAVGIQEYIEGIIAACRGQTSPGMLQGYTFPSLSLLFLHTQTYKHTDINHIHFSAINSYEGTETV